MGNKIRKQIYIEKEQERLLKYLSRRSKMSVAELIRESIDLQLKNIPFPMDARAAWKAESSYIQRLIRKGPVTGRRSWRRKDLHER